MVARIIALASLLLLGCGEGSEAELESDAGIALADASAPDALVEAEGFGSISGECDVLDTELVSAEPGLFQVAIDFQRLYTEADKGQLSAGAQKIIDDGNAGGSSLLSEVFAFEVLERCEMATLLKTENEIVYDAQGKITDFLAMLEAEKIGVSVTRAVAFPFDDPYPVAMAQDLLEGKLGDVLLSSANVSAEDRWTKQILAVLAYGPSHTQSLAQAYAALSAQVKADTLVLVIQTDGSDDFIYCDGLCQ